MAKDKASRFTLKEKSWILYDWANSVYATNIMAAIFPPEGYGTALASSFAASSKQM